MPWLTGPSSAAVFPIHEVDNAHLIVKLSYFIPSRRCRSFSIANPWAKPDAARNIDKTPSDRNKSSLKFADKLRWDHVLPTWGGVTFWHQTIIRELATTKTEKLA